MSYLSPVPDAPDEMQDSLLKRVHFRRYFRAFPVHKPVTVYVRASRCHVNIHYHDLDQVELHASLYAAFGLRVVVEQDKAGVYVVGHRRRLLGLFSRSEFTVTLPTYSHLALSLTPGSVRFAYVQGTLKVPPLEAMWEPHRVLSMPEFQQLQEQSLDMLESGHK
jgi:hypothetical protein